MKPDINSNEAHTFEHNPCCLVPGIFLYLRYSDTSLCFALEELYSISIGRLFVASVCMSQRSFTVFSAVQ